MKRERKRTLLKQSITEKLPHPCFDSQTERTFEPAPPVEGSGARTFQSSATDVVDTVCDFKKKTLSQVGHCCGLESRLESPRSADGVRAHLTVVSIPGPGNLTCSLGYPVWPTAAVPARSGHRHSGSLGHWSRAAGTFALRRNARW